MNNEQKKLYKEWKKLESKIHSSVIYFKDLEIIKSIRERVWNELKDFLNIDEKFDIGTRLNKTSKEIFQQKWPPENWPQNKILANGAIFRANSGFHFLNECLEHFHRGGTDFAYSRSLYILFSYNVELILEARLLLTSNQTDRTKLIEGLKVKPPHDLENLSGKLPKNDLLNIGIKSIKRKSNSDFKEYIVEMVDGNKIGVQDLEDVRYDFKKDQLRNPDPNEANRMKGEIEILLGITKKIIEMLQLS